ncbi:sensor histidine kinase [Pontibacillus halophilus JSM 076056 = DSM 19796]|uniref:histidine kinase n=1 Tax=Pontibacillus halophilus JSM 076056 = DSM 19796 TaxID=1385510 RepID=A0A0A5GHY9_9BACI|nr:HAMP domain-containing sensor histidine kinase [Pontibacillus halophilus]KGX92866.1 sensor histidine kinase [Pontibacillus halophilus JSM 076056 = DSM 19796]
MKRRVVLSFMVVILLMLVLVETVLYFGVKEHYYVSMANTLQRHAETSASFFNKYEDQQLRNYKGHSDEIIHSFQYPGTRLELLDREGKVLFSSTGFMVPDDYPLPKRVLTGEETYDVESMETTDESVLASYSPLMYNGQTIAVLKYTTSLEEANRTIRTIMLWSVAIGSTLSIFVFFVSLWIANSLVTPIREITKGASNLTESYFQHRLNEAYPHELGRLSKTLNYMAEEIETSNRMKNEFISSISHELRTPLTGIKGWVDTLKGNKGLTDEEQEQGMEMLSSETDRLIHLVEELLDFSRFQSNRIILHKEYFCLSHLIQEVYVQLEPYLLEKQITCTLVNSGAVDLFGDRARIKQVLLNLMDNAIKYSQSQTIIELSLEYTSEEARVRIKDEGIGIQQEKLPHVKETFYQSDTRQAGSGLGLAVSDKIVKLHGGHLEIQSEWGKGTEVIVVLPRG